MAERAKNTSAGVVCGGTLKAGTVYNNVSSDSGSNAVGIAARNLIAGQETNVVQSRGVPSRNQDDSHQTARPERSRSSSNTDSSQGNDTEFVAGLREKSAIGVITTEKHIVRGHLLNRVFDYGGGGAAAQYNRNLDVLNETNEIYVIPGTSGPLEGSLADDSLFKKFSPSRGSGCYKLEKPSGALVINNRFDNCPDPEYTANYREGAEKDSEKIRNLFKNFLKFSFVRTEENVCSERLPKILEKFRADVKKYECSSCFIIIMSHGGKAVNSILMDDLKYPEPDLYKDIVYKFSDHDDVRAIPKVFLVEACRDQGPPASNDPETSPASNDTETPPASNDTEMPPASKDSEIPRGIQDVLVGQSTCPHYPAGLHNVTGALYFTVIDEVFRMYAKNSTLSSMLHKVYYDKRLRERGQNPGVELYGFQEYRFKLD